MIELDSVTKRFEDETAVDAVSLRVEDGSTTILIGPSGCGKSTTLKLINGLLSPTDGQVRVGGEVVAASNARRMRLEMGYVIQDGGLFPHLTARGNATLMARHLGWNDARVDERLKELVALTEFPHAGLDRYPKELSGGQQQRVSLIRALMLDPPILLLDEPLGALDPIIRAQLQDDLAEIFASLDKTVVMVTHDMGEAVFFGDDIVLMRDGAIVQAGAARDLVESPSEPFVEDFIRAQRSPLENLSGAEEQ
ncbi:MAG: ATP-binding cassette domain-containing protein [Myxococcota bacterium]